MADTKLKLFWATGKDNFEEATYRMRDFGKAVVKPYFENVPQLMAACDLVICRAGASTISELIELEKPSILIPYDFVGQKENADVLEFENAAKIFTNETVEEAYESRKIWKAEQWEYDSWVSTYTAIAQNEQSGISNDIEKVLGRKATSLTEYLETL